MFANCTAGGMNLASGDVCLTPADPLPPIPTPYVNISQNSAAVNTFTKMIVCGGMGINLGSQVPVSSGDEPGSKGGVASGTIVGPTKFLSGSTKVIWGGQPAARMTSPTTQNNGNAAGSTISPGQTKVLLLG